MVVLILVVQLISGLRLTFGSEDGLLACLGGRERRHSPISLSMLCLAKLGAGSGRGLEVEEYLAPLIRPQLRLFVLVMTKSCRDRVM